ncbi:MAG: helicase-associated domain-containing protein, partial [Microbacteriaceae bacterium]
SLASGATTKVTAPTSSSQAADTVTEPRSFAEIVHWIYPQHNIDTSELSESPSQLGGSVPVLSHLGNMLSLLSDGTPTPVLLELLRKSINAAESENGTEPGKDAGAENEGSKTPGTVAAGSEAIGYEAQAVMAHFPADTSGLYLQADLSAIAAGPIPNRLDFLLREFADKEGLGIAPRYRFSAESLNRAWRRGLAPHDLREALESNSIAALPSSLNYLIDDSFETFDSTVVESLPNLGSLVRSSDPLRLNVLRVDPRLSRFRWQPAPEGLLTPSDAEQVSEALWGAGYPSRYTAAANTQVNERIVTSTKAAMAAAPIGQQRLEQLAYIRATNQQPDAASWALKQLNTQLGGKQALLFTVVLPQGEMQLRMIPLGIAAGRLRARDIDADSERTLPLSCVISIEPLDEDNNRIE